MPCRKKVELKIGPERLQCLVRHRLSEPERRVSVLNGVKRQCHFVFGAMVLVPEPRFLFLQMARIRQKNFQKVDSCRCAVNGPAESLLYKARKVARVINVGVRQDDCVDRARIHGRFLPISKPKFLQTLEESAVNENSLPRCFK